jgi:hypothetical protein
VGNPLTRLCRHCGTRAVNRPRCLCWSCYYTPGVRQLYPPTSKFARQGVGLGNRNAPLPPEPTAALPGTPEKVAVLEARAAARVALWHPGDPVDRPPPARTRRGTLHLADLHLAVWG